MTDRLAEIEQRFRSPSKSWDETVSHQDAEWLIAELKRLRKIERAARAAVETQKATGHVSLTLLQDVLEE